MNKIDAHHHLWHYDALRHAWIDDSMQVIRRSFEAPDLAPLLQQHQVAGTVLVQADQQPAENDYLLLQAALLPAVKGIVGWIDLLAPDLAQQLARWQQQPLMKGFRHIAQAEPDDFLARPAIIRGIRQLGQHGFTYDILIKPPQLPAALQLVQALPQQRFVIDHGAKPYIAAGEHQAWATAMRQLASYPQVYCKLSGLVTEAHWQHWTPQQLAPYLDTLLELFGPQRLLFGTDWPVCLLAASYQQVVQLVAQWCAPLSPAEQQLIWHDVAVSFYQLNMQTP